MHFSELSSLGADKMSKYINSQLLKMDNDSLYAVYLEGVENKNLPLICTCRSIIADRYCISELKKSHIDEPFKNHDIKRFFTVNKL